MEDDRLSAFYAAIPVGSCDGCHECGLKCAGEVQMTREEFLRIREALGDRPAPPARQGASAEMQAPCRFYDPRLPGCIVYAARPLICRLFGLVEWLPCPIGRRGAEVPNALEMMRWYSSQQLATYAQWLRRIGT